MSTWLRLKSLHIARNISETSGFCPCSEEKYALPRRAHGGVSPYVTTVEIDNFIDKTSRPWFSHTLISTYRQLHFLHTLGGLLFF